MRHQAMLQIVGARVRARRESKKLSRRELSTMSGVSERFLAQLEGGKGNISLSRLADVAGALHTTPGDLLAGASTGQQRQVIALLGVRGAGKSTIGRHLANRRCVDFVEVDGLIERAAGLGLAQIFEMHGEGYYRRLEEEVLSRILSENKPAVIATGGSIVNHQDNFSMLRSATCTVWLRAKAQDHWDRVIEQGDERPMAENPHAYAELKALLAERESLYASSNFVIETSGQSIDEVVAAVSLAVG
ncbi:MAG: helix-turn-helix domain-containing protein [Kofleriaceae bacterium]|nr:helix-turn-helix domain-containing protein [Kofleriaceae bacterium]